MDAMEGAAQMTETHKIANEVYDLLMFHLEHDQHDGFCACDDCYAEQTRRTYRDADGNWRTGRYYVHADLLNPGPNVSHKSDADVENLLRGVRNGLFASVALIALGWLIWDRVWPWIWRAFGF
jgi:hypothetical protein